MPIHVSARFGYPGALDDNPPLTGRFPGDPGQGRIYLGLSAKQGLDANFDDALSAPKLNRPIGVARLYENANPAADWARIDRHRAKGRIVISTINPIGAPGVTSWADVLAGLADSWIDAMIVQLKARAPWPWWPVIQHEPEGNYPTLAAAADYRAAKRYIILRVQAAGVTNVLWVDCCYMMQTFNSGIQFDWRWWNVDWKGTNVGSASAPNIADFYSGTGSSASLVGAMGFDMYNWWGHETHVGSGWKSLQQQASLAFQYTKVIYPTVPYVVGEFGCCAYCASPTHGGVDSNPGPYLCDQLGYAGWNTTDLNQTVSWFEAGYQYLLGNGVAAMAYFNSYQQYSIFLDNEDPHHYRFNELAALADKTTTILPNAAGWS